ncbi:MAG: porin family protein [Novosphingobium sp.]|nr:porin family protein [Novosphingobium sp.]
MKQTLSIIAAGSAIAIASPAIAQDAGSTFTGPRVEVTTGYEVTKAGSSVDDDVNADNDVSIDGLMYGVGIGYDFDLGGAVVGVEGELMDSTAKTTFENGDFEGFGFGSVKTNRDLYVGARVGAKVSPNALLYVKGGYSNAKLDVLSNDGTTELSEDVDLDGWRVGAGAEYALNQNAFVKLEYRYTKYEDAEIDFGGNLPDSERFDIDTDRHQIAASVGWRF